MNNLTAWQAHREAVRDISFSPDDRRFATASDDSTIKIWAFDESKEESVLTGEFQLSLLFDFCELTICSAQGTDGM